MGRLKGMVRERGYTAAEFARKAGVSKRTLDIYMSGARDFRNTPLWLAVKVADALGVDVHDLLEEEKNG